MICKIVFIKFLIKNMFEKSVELNMTNVRGVGLNRFVVNELDFNIFALTFLFNLTTPTLNLTGNHEANGVIGIIPFIGEGPFKYKLHSPKLFLS